MIVMGVNLSHDGSVAVLDDGALVFYQEEERVTHNKHTVGAINSFYTAMEEYDPDHIVFVGAFPYELNAKQLFASLMMASGKYKHFSKKKNYSVHSLRDHHIAHASVAFFNSGFDSAGVLVADGAGQAFLDHSFLYREAETVFKVDGNFEMMSKHLISQMDIDEYLQQSNEIVDMPYFSRCSIDLPKDDRYKVYSSEMSLGKMFSAVGLKIFGSHHNAGKVMGLSAYGSDNPNHPRAFSDKGGNQELLTSGLSDEDMSYRVQHDSLEVSLNLIRETIELSGSKNICLSGGYFLNCVNNYKYLKEFPDINFYVEPNSSDSGTAIGAAMLLHKELTGSNPEPLSTLYLGGEATYNHNILDNNIISAVGPDSVASLISRGNVVAIYQGRAEAGPRALGNRSIMYDPRDPKGRDIVNAIKKREPFRPFAGSVLEENANDWFDLAGMKSSPDMMYAVEIWPHKQKLVPALQHNDGTSRVQTVSREQNPNYYRVIEEFYKITGVPMVLNTSFNLAGDTLVDTLEDAIRTCTESGIKYLYLPDLGKLYTVIQM